MEPMGKPTDVRTFPGLQTNLDHDDMDNGAAVVQINITGISPHELRVRPGMRPVDWEN